MTGRRFAFLLLFVAGVAAAMLAAPRRYEVDGISMGPGFLPGDILQTGWFPRLRAGEPARRFERWLVRLPDGSQGVKRVVGLPGEVVDIDGGDLQIDGRTILKSPRELAELGSLVDPPGDLQPDLPRDRVGLPGRLIRDAAAFEPAETTRRLVPVPDAGLAAVVRLDRREPAHALIVARAGPLTVRWRVRAAGRFAVAIGRLDGRAVAAAWPLPSGVPSRPLGRACLPAGAPDAWAVVEPWPADPAARHAAAVDIAVGAPPGASVPSAPAAVIEDVHCWRDILYRPAANAITRWRLGPGAVFLLGDFPSGSHDGRQFGPLPQTALELPVRGWAAGRR